MEYPYRLDLARLPTPIQKLERLSKEIGKDVFVWRVHRSGGNDLYTGIGSDQGFEPVDRLRL